MQLRDLRAFVAAAEEGSFTRAAARLYLTQQGVSAAVRRLERDVGAELIVRGARGTDLTAAGHALLGRARDLVERADRLGEAVAPPAAAARPLRVGVFANGASALNHPILAAFRTRHPGAGPALCRLGPADQVSAVAEGRVDVAVVRPPLGADARVEVTTLLVEPQVALLAAGHPLAGAGALRAADLLAEPFLDAHGPPGWMAHWQLAAHRGGEPVRLAPLDPVDDMATANALVALGLAVTTTAASCERDVPHPAVRHVPIVDALGSEVAVVRPRHGGHPLAAAFAATAAEVARELAGLVPGAVLPG